MLPNCTRRATSLRPVSGSDESPDAQRRVNRVLPAAEPSPWLREIGVGRKSPTRAVVFSERIRTLDWIATAIRAEFDMTDDQVQKLKKIELGGALQPSAADQSAIRQLWEGYTRASDGPSKMDAQKKLTEKLDAGIPGTAARLKTDWN